MGHHSNAKRIRSAQADATAFAACHDSQPRCLGPLPYGTAQLGRQEGICPLGVNQTRARTESDAKVPDFQLAKFRQPDRDERPSECLATSHVPVARGLNMETSEETLRVRGAASI